MQPAPMIHASLWMDEIRDSFMTFSSRRPPKPPVVAFKHTEAFNHHHHPFITMATRRHVCGGKNTTSSLHTVVASELYCIPPPGGASGTHAGRPRTLNTCNLQPSSAPTHKSNERLRPPNSPLAKQLGKLAEAFCTGRIWAAN